MIYIENRGGTIFNRISSPRGFAAILLLPHSVPVTVDLAVWLRIIKILLFYI